MDEMAGANDMTKGGRRNGGGASTKWSRASAILVAGAAMSGARAWAQGSGASEAGLAAWRKSWRLLGPADALEWTGLSGIVLALLLLGSAPYLARNRRQWAILAVGVLCCGAGGYALYDHDYLLVNLRLIGNTTALRAECERLMRVRASLPLEPGVSGYMVIGADLSESMQRSQIQMASMNEDSIVMLFSMRYSVGPPPIVYAPDSTLIRGGLRKDLRRTWFPQFYQFPKLER